MTDDAKPIGAEPQAAAQMAAESKPSQAEKAEVKQTVGGAKRTDSAAEVSLGGVETGGGATAWALPRALVILLGLAAAVIAAAGIKELAGVIAPTFLALTLVIAVHPLQTFLLKKNWPRPLAALVCLLLIYVTVLGLMGALILSIVQFSTLLPQYQGQFVSLYSQLEATANQLLLPFRVNLNQIISGFDPTQFSGTILSALNTLTGPVAGGTLIMVFLITVLVFLVMDSIEIPERLKLATRARPQFVGALDAFAVGVRRYWLVSAIFGLIVAVIDVVGLWILGVPLPLVWGLVSFITNFIPNVGFVLGLIPPALLALLDGGEHGVRNMIIVIVFYSIANFVIQVLIQPRFTGDAVGVTTTISFLSLAVWAVILGPLGALLALPATLFVKAMLVDADPRNRWLNAFLASRPHNPR